MFENNLLFTLTAAITMITKENLQRMILFAVFSIHVATE